jgi:hypothetical protein
MPTNGHGADHEALASVERAITGSRLAMQPTPNVQPIDHSLTGDTEVLAEQYRALGRHALEHGQYISQACNEYADRLLSDHRKLASTVLAAERKLVVDHESFIGAAREAARG